MTEFPPPDRWLPFEGVQRRAHNGERLIEIGEGRHWLPESEMEILEHDEQLGNIKFRLTKRAARIARLIET